MLRHFSIRCNWDIPSIPIISGDIHSFIHPTLQFWPCSFCLHTYKQFLLHQYFIYDACAAVSLCAMCCGAVSSAKHCDFYYDYIIISVCTIVDDTLKLNNAVCDKCRLWQAVVSVVLDSNLNDSLLLLIFLKLRIDWFCALFNHGPQYVLIPCHCYGNSMDIYQYLSHFVTGYKQAIAITDWWF